MRILIDLPDDVLKQLSFHATENNISRKKQIENIVNGYVISLNEIRRIYDTRNTISDNKS
jgi:hypothetical protein